MDAFDDFVEADPDLLDGAMLPEEGVSELDLVIAAGNPDDDLSDVDLDAADAGDNIDTSSSSGGSDEDGEPEDSDLPSYNPLTGQVTTRSEVPEPLGRISLIKIGTPAEAVSIYCRRHGCSIMKRCAQSPSHPALLEWFKAGLDIPKGHEPGLSSKHKRLFPKGEGA